MTKNEKIDVGVMIAMILTYSLVVFYISSNYRGSERWLWMALFLACAFVLGRVINCALKRVGLRD